MKPNTKTDHVTVRLGPKLKRKVERQAKEKEMSISEYIRYLLLAGLIALALAAPAAADAPTLDQRVTTLEQQVKALQDKSNCIAGAVVVNRRHDGTLYVAKHPRRHSLYMALMNRDCGPSSFPLRPLER